MEEIIIKILKENSTYLDRSRSYEGIYEEDFEYVAKELIKQLTLTNVVVPKGTLCDKTDDIIEKGIFDTYTKDSKSSDYA